MKVHLIGENNPYGPDPEYALYPSPRGCAGWNLCRILGLNPDDYLETFERRNLLSLPKWSVPAAREAAVALLSSLHPGEALVLCGGKVSNAFGFEFVPLARLTSNTGHRVLIIPHPSGLSRQWAIPGMRERVREAVMGMVGERQAA